MTKRDVKSGLIDVKALLAADEDYLRNGRLFIRRSHHVPASAKAVRDLISVFFELLKEARFQV